MAPQKAQAHCVGYVGGFYHVVPANQKSASSSSSSRGRQLKESSEIESSTKSLVKGSCGKSSSGFKKAYKAEEFVDKSTGRLGYKEEVKYTRSEKFHDNKLGYTHEYETQVKLKHVVYPNTKNVKGSTSSSSNSKSKNIKGSTSSSGNKKSTSYY